MSETGLDVTGGKAVQKAMASTTGKLSKRKQKQISKDMEQVNQLLKEMVTDGMTLSLKVASCPCNHKDGCGVFEEARKIAQTLDKLNSLKTK